MLGLISPHIVVILGVDDAPISKKIYINACSYFEERFHVEWKRLTCVTLQIWPLYGGQ